MKPAIIETVVIGLLVGWLVGWLSFCVDVRLDSFHSVYQKSLAGVTLDRVLTQPALRMIDKIHTTDRIEFGFFFSPVRSNIKFSTTFSCAEPINSKHNDE